MRLKRYNGWFRMESWLESSGLTPSAVVWVAAGIRLAAFIVPAILFWIFGGLTLRRFAQGLEPRDRKALWRLVRGLVAGALVITGLYSAIDGTEYGGDELLGKLYSAAWVVLLLIATIRGINLYARIWSEKQADTGTRTVSAKHKAYMAQRVATIVVMGIAGVYMVRIAGADISPLLAGGAIGGIVLGLALQETLQNLFAGIFMNLHGTLRVGDLIKLETGEEGFVEEVGWRFARIRLWTNAEVIVPNSSLSQGRVTNYNMPEPSTAIVVPCGVSYKSDLEHVERVTLEVARETIAADEFGDDSVDPVLRWREFGESAILFTVSLRSVNPVGQYRIRSEFIKNLHRRYREEGIEIPYPQRDIHLRSGAVESLS